MLGRAFLRKGQVTEVHPHFERALQLAQASLSTGPQHEALRDLEWDALVWLGWLSEYRNDYNEAETRLAQALHICQTLGNLRGEGQCLAAAGEVAMTVGDISTALKNLQDGLRLAQEQGNRLLEGQARLFLGVTALADSNYTLARDSAEGALKILHDIGEQRLEAWAMASLGRLADALADYAHAHDWLDQSLCLSRDIGAWEAQFYACVFLALLSHHETDNETSLRYAEQSRQIAVEAGDRSLQADAWQAVGRAHEVLRRLSEAATAYPQALALYTEIGRMHMTTEPTAGLARIAWAQGDQAQAQMHVEEVLKFLENHPLIGPDEPFRIYLTCYRVLNANHDPRATSLLHTAHQLLMSHADHITDEALRRLFLENVTAHRELLRAYADLTMAARTFA